jgi:hypothetical protein
MRMGSRRRTAHTVRLVLLTGPLPPGARSAPPATSRSRCARASVRRRPARWTRKLAGVPCAAAPSRTDVTEPGIEGAAAPAIARRSATPHQGTRLGGSFDCTHEDDLIGRWAAVRRDLARRRGPAAPFEASARPPAPAPPRRGLEPEPAIRLAAGPQRLGSRRSSAGQAPAMVEVSRTNRYRTSPAVSLS